MPRTYTTTELAALLRLAAEWVEDAPAKTGGAEYIKQGTLRELTAAANALDAQGQGMTWEERVEIARETLTEYDRRDMAWSMREAASLTLRAAFPEYAPKSED